MELERSDSLVSIDSVLDYGLSSGDANELMLGHGFGAGIGQVSDSSINASIDMLSRLTLGSNRADANPVPQDPFTEIVPNPYYIGISNGMMSSCLLQGAMVPMHTSGGNNSLLDFLMPGANMGARAQSISGIRPLRCGDPLSDALNEVIAETNMGAGSQTRRGIRPLRCGDPLSDALSEQMAEAIMGAGSQGMIRGLDTRYGNPPQGRIRGFGTRHSNPPPSSVQSSVRGIVSACPCGNIFSCPLQGLCYQSMIIYLAVVEGEPERFYIGRTSKSFITRYKQHMYRIRIEDGVNGLVKYVIRSSKHSIKWTILEHADTLQELVASENMHLQAALRRIGSQRHLMLNIQTTARLRSR